MSSPLLLRIHINDRWILNWACIFLSPTTFIDRNENYIFVGITLDACHALFGLYNLGCAGVVYAFSWIEHAPHAFLFRGLSRKIFRRCRCWIGLWHCFSCLWCLVLYSVGLLTCIYSIDLACCLPFGLFSEYAIFEFELLRRQLIKWISLINSLKLLQWQNSLMAFASRFKQTLLLFILLLIIVNSILNLCKLNLFLKILLVSHFELRIINF